MTSPAIIARTIAEFVAVSISIYALLVWAAIMELPV